MKKFKKNNYQLKSLFFAIVLLFDIRAVNSQTPAEIIGDQFIYTNKNIKQENSNQDNQLNLSQQNSKNKEVAVKSPQNNYSQTLNDTTKQVNLDLNKIAKTIDNNKSKDINKTKSKILEKKKNISIGKKSSEGEVIAVLKKEAKNLSPLEINKNKYLELEAEFDRNSQNIEPQSRNNDMFLSKEPPSPIIANNIRTTENIHIPLFVTKQDIIDGAFLAIYQNDVNSFNELYKKINDPNAKSNTGDTFLTYATMLSRYSLMTAILAKGSNPDLANDLGYRSMQIAIEKKDLNSVQILKNYNADIGFQDKFGNNYLIHSAIVDSFELVEFFANFININSCNQDGLNAISFAQANKNKLIIDLLLAKGVKFIDEKNIDKNKTTNLIDSLQKRWN
jgi:ankyrin repeat protein